MRRLVQTLLGLAAAALFAAAPTLAQSGKLSGRVTDPTGAPLPGVSVVIDGTTIGAATDRDGDYAILRVPPGTYAVRFSFVGFQPQRVEGVFLASNQTTTLNAVLREEVIGGEEVVITAERPVVDVTLTSTIATVSRDQIDLLPVQELSELVNLQAGVVDGHFRGGRIGEVQYQVNGVSVNNPYNNSSTVTLDRSVLQEVQVVSGTFDAEYGQALSGVVNAVLRTGEADRFEFAFETYAGDYFSPGNDSVRVRGFEGPTPVEREVVLFPFIEELNPATLQNYQFSLSGPLFGRTTFLLNGQRNVDMGHLSGQRRFLPVADFDTLDIGGGEVVVLRPNGDSTAVPMNSEKRWSFLGKLTNRLIPNVQLSYQAIGGLTERRPYAHGFRFNPDGLKTANEFSLVHGLDVVHTLSNATFYELGLRHNYFDYTDYKYEDLFDPRYDAAGVPTSLDNYENGAVVYGVDLGRFIQRTNSFVAKASVTTQVNKQHLVKLGYEIQSARLRFGTPGLLRTEGENLIREENTPESQVTSYAPLQGAFFIQDRIELQDLRIRVGLRLEHFDANATIPSDLANPANAIPGAPASRPVDTSVKVVLAPRLGISFPILTTTSVFFSYGHFYQMPGLGIFFNNADYSRLRDLQIGEPLRYGIFGFPDLKPEFTAMYEFGFKSALNANLGLDVNLFYKDIRDLLGTKIEETYTTAQYARFTNFDFGGVRGFTVSIDQRNLGPLSATLDYTFQEAVGNTSDPRDTANRVASGQALQLRQLPLNWDQRHTFNVSALLSKPDSYALTSILRLSSGQPYTPEADLLSRAEPNSARKRASVVVDVRAEKYFSLGRVNLTGFARVFNLFDTHFYNGFVYSDTGSAFFTTTPSQINPDPQRLYAPRRIEIGLSLRGVLPVGAR